MKNSIFLTKIVLLTVSVGTILYGTSNAGRVEFLSSEADFYRGLAEADFRYMEKCSSEYLPAKNVLRDDSRSYVIIQRVNEESAKYAILKVYIHADPEKYVFVDCEGRTARMGFLKNRIDNLIASSNRLSGSYDVGVSVFDGPSYYVTIKDGINIRRFRSYAPSAYFPAKIDPQMINLLRNWANIIDAAGS